MSFVAYRQFMRDWIGIGLKMQNTNGPCPTKIIPAPPCSTKANLRMAEACFAVINYRDPAEVIDSDYPVWLTTGRRLQAYHTRTQTGRSAGINYLLSEEALEVHPHDLDDWQLTDGGFANLTSRRGTVKIRVRSSEQSPSGHGLL